MSVEQVADNVDALRWFKSSYSGSDGGDCVNVAAGLDAVYVQNSKVAAGGPVLRVGRSAWDAFVALARQLGRPQRHTVQLADVSGRCRCVNRPVLSRRQ